MTLQQLRYLCEIVDCGLSISKAAEQLHVSQPGISKILKSLETELGFEILVRRGNRMIELTAAGREVVATARNILSETRNLKAIAADRVDLKSGSLRVATTHLQARYALLDVIQKFALRYPAVDLHLIQGSMKEIARLVLEGNADIGVCAAPSRIPDDMVALDAYPIERCVIAPANHPLLALRKSTIRDLAKYPLITYDDTNNAGVIALQEFRKHDLEPRISMTATDANVIKAYVTAGLGIAVLQRMAIEPRTDRGIRILSKTHAFPASMTSLIFRRGQYLRGYTYELIRMISPRLTREAMDKAIRRLKKD